MDLIYADTQRIDIGVLTDYKFDLAFGKDENNFELELSLESHCCEAGYYLYMEGTEYGGIIDKIKVDTNNQKVVYSGRTWHGILAGKVIAPDEGDNYYTVTGDAHEVLAELIELLGLSDLFRASDEISAIDVGEYSFRYDDGYSGICSMLAEFSGKLRIEYRENSVLLSAVSLMDYSQDEEWDSSQVGFEIEKNYRPVNHLICLGSGNLKDRHVIHLFTDEYGGVQPYTKTDAPLEDSDYILTTEHKLLHGTEEVAEVYDYPDVGTIENYVLLTKEPASWSKVYKNYYAQEEDSYVALVGEEVDTYVLQAQKPYDWGINYIDYYMKSGSEYVNVESVSEAIYTLQTAQPSDWASGFDAYFMKDGGDFYAVPPTENVTYTKQKKKPSNWKNDYQNYYYFYSDGIVSEYRNVPGESKYLYEVQTQPPTDWESNYNNYYVYAKTGEFAKVSGIVMGKKEFAPAWEPRRYYTKISYNVAPKWKKGTYYTCKRTESVPVWEANKYYTKSINEVPAWQTNTYYTLVTKTVHPRFISGFYYEKKVDHFAALVSGGLERLKESYACDSININLDLEGRYDIGDIVGARENTTGISVWQPISKKIVTIQKSKETITYEIG